MMISTLKATSKTNLTKTNDIATSQLTTLNQKLDAIFTTTSLTSQASLQNGDISNIDTTTQLNQVAKLLNQACNISNIRTLLTALLHSPQLLTQIAERSYWHGNGFLKVVLLDNGYKLRLHIWFAGTACEENIHSHRWGFASHILTGTLKSELWADAANDEVVTDLTQKNSQILQAKEYLYTAKHHNGHSNVAAQKQYVGMASLRKIQDVAQVAGESYIMTPDQLHRINHPGQELVATIICTEPTSTLTNRLIPTHDNPKLQPSNLTAEQLKQALSQYLQQVA